MIRNTFASLIVLSCVVGSVNANPTIMAGNHSLLPNTPNQSFYISITPGPAGNANAFGGADGNEQTIPAVDLMLWIAPNPQRPVGSPDVRPYITAVDLIGPGLVGSGIPTARQVYLNPLAPPAWEVGTTAIWGLGTQLEVFANGFLARVTVDTSGILDTQSWPFSLTSPAIQYPTAVGYDPFLPGTLGNGSVTLIDGTLSTVPEPSSLVLAAIGILLLGTIVRRQRRPRT